MHKLRVSEYARLMSDNEKSVYRKIHKGELQSEKINGVLHVICEELPSDPFRDMSDIQILAEKDARIEQLETENEYLRKQLEQAMGTIQQMQTDAESSKERSDTIILQFTQQLNEQTKLLEDMRNQKTQGFWARLFKRKAPLPALQSENGGGIKGG